jgi:regulator of nucleoside diphosphate kinase
MIKVLKVSKHCTVTGREILITKHDMKRLRTIIEIYEWNDAPYLKRLAEELDQAEVVEPKDIPSDIVTMNSVVRIKDLDTDEERTFALVFPGRTKMGESSVSITAPMGTALIGSREGSEIKWKSTEGMKKFQIVEILYQPERLGNYYF